MVLSDSISSMKKVYPLTAESKDFLKMDPKFSTWISFFCLLYYVMYSPVFWWTLTNRKGPIFSKKKSAQAKDFSKVIASLYLISNMNYRTNKIILCVSHTILSLVCYFHGWDIIVNTISQLVPAILAIWRNLYIFLSLLTSTSNFRCNWKSNVSSHYPLVSLILHNTPHVSRTTENKMYLVWISWSQQSQR